MRYPLFLLMAVATGAMGKPGVREPWPSLAKRATETAVPIAGSDAVPDVRASGVAQRPGAAGSSGLAAAAIGSGSTLVNSDVAARLAIAERDVDSLEQRWRAQKSANQQANAAVQARPGIEAAATAQLETGRFDKLTGQVADETSQLEAIAGELAMAAATGLDVTAPLRTAGSLLSRCAKLSPERSAAVSSSGLTPVDR